MNMSRATGKTTGARKRQCKETRAKGNQSVFAQVKSHLLGGRGKRKRPDEAHPPSHERADRALFEGKHGAAMVAPAGE